MRRNTWFVTHEGFGMHSDADGTKGGDVESTTTTRHVEGEHNRTKGGVSTARELGRAAESDAIAAKRKFIAGETKHTAVKDKLTTAKDELTAAEIKLTTAEIKLTTAESKLTAAKDELTAAETKLTAAKEEGDEESVIIAREHVRTAQAGVSTAQRLVDSYTQEVVRLMSMSNAAAAYVPGMSQPIFTSPRQKCLNAGFASLF